MKVNDSHATFAYNRMRFRVPLPCIHRFLISASDLRVASSVRRLTCYFSSVPYSRTYVDLDNKPQWLFDINPDGTVPILKNLATGEWTVGSDVVSDLMEKEFPEPSVGTVAGSPDVAGSLLASFKGFLNAEGDNTSKDSKEKEAKLREVLSELDAFLEGKKYIGGDSVCQTDFLVMPRLYHMKVACKEFRGWEMGADEYTNVKAYMDRFMARDSWKNTAYGPELVIKGWERHGVKRV